MKTALVDGDILVYVCGFAAEETTYCAEDGELFGTLGQAKKHSEDNKLSLDKIEALTEAEPKSHVFHLIKNVLSRVKTRTGAKEVKIYLTGVNNFRDAVATIRPYKGNRVARKPHHYDNVRSYLIDKQGAEVVDNMEADDALGINQSKDSCICTIDKDLDMIPGYHYNFQKDRLYDVPKSIATKNFYTQLLTGDTTDNIVGVPKIGIKTAKRILDKCTDEEDMYWECLKAYAGQYTKPYEALLENGRLLWILREEGEIWEPKW